MKSSLVLFIKKYTPVDDRQAEILADYAMMTWLPLPREVRYLHITADPGLNTNVVMVMEAVCQGGFVADGELTYQSILRILDALPGVTPIISEGAIAEQDLLSLLENGHQPSCGLAQMQGQQPNLQPIMFNAFGYKVIIGNFNLPNSIKAHCIQVHLSASTDLPKPRDFERDAAWIRTSLYDVLALGVDLAIMDDFDTNLYGWGRMSNQLTDRQQLQLEIASIRNTSLDDAKSSVGKVGTLALRHALALARQAERKGLVAMIARELKRRGEEEWPWER